MASGKRRHYLMEWSPKLNHEWKGFLFPFLERDISSHVRIDGQPKGMPSIVAGNSKDREMQAYMDEL
jgi:hypothetical protein